MASNSNFRMSIYMCKDGTKPSECTKDIGEFKKREKIIQHKIKIKNIEGILTLGKTKNPNTPIWIKFCESLLGSNSSLGEFKDILISTSALFAFKSKSSKNTFALTFGHGSKYLEHSKTIKNFGRNVVLNTANPEKFHSLRAKSFDGTLWNKEHQSAIPSNILKFEVDTNYELISRVTAEASEGIPKKYYDPLRKSHENLLSNKFTGYDSLNLNSKIDINELSGFCHWLETTYKNKRYKQLIRNIDAFSPVKDSDEINQLENQLISSIKSRTPSSQKVTVFIAPPDFIDHEALEGYSLTPKKYNPYDDGLVYEFALEQIIQKVGIDKLTLEKLKKINLLAFKDGEVFKSWPLFNCLIVEISNNKKTYAMFDSEWFQIESNYIKKLSTEVNQYLTTMNGSIPFIEYCHQTEPLFIEDQGKSKSFQVLDEKFLLMGGNNKIEICDLIYANKTLIHAKRYGNASGISHLSFQAMNSTSLIVNDPKLVNAFFKEKMQAKDASTVISNVKKSSFKVHLLILHEKENFSGSKKIGNLSVFCIIALHRAMKTITQLIGKNNFKIHLREKKHTP